MNIGAVGGVIFIHGIEYDLGCLSGRSIIKIHQIWMVFKNGEVGFYG
jgi:hypothetical protein